MERSAQPATPNPFTTPTARSGIGSSASSASAPYVVSAAISASSCFEPPTEPIQAPVV